MSERKAILHDELFHTRLEELKKSKGDPPWAEPVVITDQNVGTVICQAPGHPNDRHYHIYDEWWLVLEGEIHWEIEGRSEPVKARSGDFVFVPKNHFHHIHVKGDSPTIRLAISVPGEPHRHERP
ncbi:MAG: cupin domain-containing protein [Candidatus Tectomicrobia bacterium]|nr:cupin domain-containing protein [Candidatus Tectomicrobia bacterium]